MGFKVIEQVARILLESNHDKITRTFIRSKSPKGKSTPQSKKAGSRGNAMSRQINRILGEMEAVGLIRRHSATHVQILDRAGLRAIQGTQYTTRERARRAFEPSLKAEGRHDWPGQ